MGQQRNFKKESRAHKGQAKSWPRKRKRQAEKRRAEAAKAATPQVASRAR
jgi:hypothetical protein